MLENCPMHDQVAPMGSTLIFTELNETNKHILRINNISLTKMKHRKISLWVIEYSPASVGEKNMFSTKFYRSTIGFSAGLKCSIKIPYILMKIMSLTMTISFDPYELF